MTRFGRRGASAYRTGYLTSTVWYRRRDAWFRAEAEHYGHIRCALCTRTGGPRDFELHHLDYDGVVQRPDGSWVAGEAHRDLIALHTRCHEWLHSLLDRDRALSAAASRRLATERALARLQAKFAAAIEHELEEGHH